MGKSIESRLTAIEDRIAPAPEPSDWERFREAAKKLVFTPKAMRANDMRRHALVIENEGGPADHVAALQRNGSRLLAEAADDAGNPAMAEWIREIGGVKAGEPMEPAPPLSAYFANE